MLYNIKNITKTYVQLLAVQLITHKSNVLEHFDMKKWLIINVNSLIMITEWKTMREVHFPGGRKNDLYWHINYTTMKTQTFTTQEGIFLLTQSTVVIMYLQAPDKGLDQYCDSITVSSLHFHLSFSWHTHFRPTHISLLGHGRAKRNTGYSALISKWQSRIIISVFKHCNTHVSSLLDIYI